MYSSRCTGFEAMLFSVYVFICGIILVAATAPSYWEGLAGCVVVMAFSIAVFRYVDTRYVMQFYDEDDETTGDD